MFRRFYCDLACFAYHGHLSEIVSSLSGAVLIPRVSLRIQPVARMTVSDLLFRSPEGGLPYR